MVETTKPVCLSTLKDERPPLLEAAVGRRYRERRQCPKVRRPERLAGLVQAVGPLT